MPNKPSQPVTGGRCTHSSDRFCFDCDDDTPNQDFFNDMSVTDLSDCPTGDPDCSNSLNLIFYYNESTLQDVFDGDLDALDAWTNNMVASLNETARNSPLLPPDHNVRKVALAPVYMTPRYDSVSALAWARFNEDFQEKDEPLEPIWASSWSPRQPPGWATRIICTIITSGSIAAW